MISSETAKAPMVAKAPQLTPLRTHRQTAIVRTVVDEIERCERALELTDELTLQMIDELRRLARRVTDVADALERDVIEPVEPSGIRLRSAL